MNYTSVRRQTRREGINRLKISDGGQLIFESLTEIILNIMKFMTIVLYLSCVMFALLMTPSEAAPAPAPSPQLGLESLLLAKLLFLKGYLVGQYLHANNARSGAA